MGKALSQGNCTWTRALSIANFELAFEVIRRVSVLKLRNRFIFDEEKSEEEVIKKIKEYLAH